MIKRILIKIVKFYQKFVSPMFPPRCRFYPSCSAYAILAIEKYGVFKGLGKAVWRVMRCNPWNDGGVDFP